MRDIIKKKGIVVLPGVIDAIVDGESGGTNMEGTIREFRMYEEASMGAIQFDDEFLRMTEVGELDLRNF